VSYNTKINTITSQQMVFFQARNALKTVFGRGFAPDPTGGAYDAPPGPLVGWGGGHPLPISPLAAFGGSILDAFGVSISSAAFGGSVLDAFGVSFSVYPPLFLAIHH